eukprot:1158926-Pelagomonas_calceolata.AAC.5
MATHSGTDKGHSLRPLMLTESTHPGAGGTCSQSRPWPAGPPPQGCAPQQVCAVSVAERTRRGVVLDVALGELQPSKAIRQSFMAK